MALRCHFLPLTTGALRMIFFQCMKNNKKKYPNNLRRHRDLAGLSRKQLARLLNVRNENMISRWERGLAMPSVINLMQMKILYRATTDVLYHQTHTCIEESLKQRLKKYNIPIKNQPFPHRSTNR